MATSALTVGFWHLDLKCPISPQLEHLTRATVKCQRCSCPLDIVLTVSGLGAASGLVTILITVATLDLGHVARLRTLTRSVTLAITVATDDLLLFGAIARKMALLAAVVTSAAASTATLRAVAGEMAGCEKVRNN